MTIVTHGSDPDGRDVARTIRRRHRGRLDELRRLLFSPAGAFDPDDPAPQRPPSLDVRAVTDRHTRVTVAANIQSRLDDEVPMQAGTRLLRVSVAGHHHQLHRRQRLAAGEEEGWARAVVGEAWERLVHRQGVVAWVDGQPGAAHFLLYLGADGDPVSPPRSVTVPLTPLAARPQLHAVP